MENQNTQPNPPVDFTKQFSFKLENLLKFLFCAFSFISIIPSKITILGQVAGLMACYMGLTRQIGGIRFNKEYLGSFIRNEFGNTIFYIALLFMVDGPKVVFSFPVVLFFVIGLSELALRSDISILKSNWVQEKARVVVAYKNDIKVARCIVELLLFFYSIVLVIIGKIGFMFPIMAFNYLRIRGMANPLCNQTFTLVQNKILGKLNGINLPGKGVLIKIVSFLFGMFTKVPGNN